MRVCPQCNSLFGPEQERCPRDGEPTKKFEDVLIGQTLGPYIVQSVLGEGGMGVVYAGEHPTIGRKVALKVLRPELSLRDNIVDQFIEEARSVNTIGHDNIVNIYDFGKTPFGSFYIVMEYLNGQTLRSILDNEGPQPMNRIRTLVRGVGAALSAAHAKGYVHRDVKPENIMLIHRRGQEFVKLLDFGIVKLLSDQPSAMTQVGGALGTPEYMSPEQLDQRPLDHRSDIYSLSVVTYEAITGNLPYPGRSDAEVKERQLSASPPPPSVCRQDMEISRKLDAAIFWAFSLDPANRCTTVVDFLTAFEDGYQSTLRGDLEPHTAPSAPPANRSRVIVALVGALLVVALGVIIILVVKPWEGTPVPARPAPPVAARPDSRARPAVKEAPVLSTGAAMEQAQARVLQGLRSRDVETRRTVVQHLAHIKKPLLTQQLTDCLADKDRPVRRFAAEALASMGARDAVPALRKAHKESMGFHAIYYATALARLGDPVGLAYLKRKLKAPQNAIHKKTLLRALGMLGDPSAGAWKQFLDESKFATDESRIEGHGYLARLGDKQARDWLVKATREKDWPARIMAAEALGHVDLDSARLVLRQAVEQAPGTQRAVAAAILAYFGDATSLKTLIEFAGAQDIAVRAQSTLALGYMSGERTLATLSKALRDPEEKVALAAAVALLMQHYRSPR